MPGVLDEEREGSEELATVQEVLPEIPPDLQRKLKHIEEISKNARGTWLSLIAVLLFSAIAVAGVKDSDYFIYGAGLVLPVINVTVPVKSFFYAGPLIILGLYTYLHLYLLKLWRALAETGAEPVPGLKLDDLVFPWLISDAAIFLKADSPGPAVTWSARLTWLVAFVFLWLATPAVLVLFWLWSFPPHDLFLTSWVGLLTGLSLAGGSVSLWTCICLLRRKPGEPASRLLKDLAGLSHTGAVLAASVLLVCGLLRTVGTWQAEWVFFNNEEEEQNTPSSFANLRFSLSFGRDDWIYSANLYRAELVERPSNWLPREEALEEFKARYSGEKRKVFQAEGYENTGWIASAEQAFKKQRDSLLTRLRALDFPSANLRKANLEQAFLPGLDLRDADLRTVYLERATLEGADLMGANMQDADLRDANLQYAFLRDANLQNANLFATNLQDADLGRANLQDAYMWGANLQDADLRRANLQDAFLWRANLQDTDLGAANLQDADLRGVNLQDADLGGANLQDAELRSANLQDADLGRANLQDADLRGANLQDAYLGGADASKASLQIALLASVDLSVVQNLTQVQIDWTYGDGSTKLPEGWDWPSHWPKRQLEAEEVEVYWQEWLLSRRAEDTPTP